MEKPQINSLEDYKENYCPYPYYGLAPHTHNRQFNEDGKLVLSITCIDKSKGFPANFTPDEEGANCGVYVCPYAFCDDSCPDYQEFKRIDHIPGGK